MNSSQAPESADCSYYVRFLAGDESALEGLYDLYAQSLTLFINSYLNNLADAEDLMIDAFARLCAARKQLEGTGLKRYLFAIGRNLAMRRLRRQGRMRLMAFSLTPPSDENAPEAILLRRERLEALESAMEGLNTDYREALYLVYCEEMSYRDAGIVLCKSEKQIANLIYRAKSSLRVKLKIAEVSYDQ